MTKKEFFVDLQKSCHLDTVQCNLLLSCLQRVLGKAGVEQVPVVMSRLGVFASHKHPEYIQEDPATGAMTLYPPRISYRMQSEDMEGAVTAAELLTDYAKVDQEESEVFVNAFVKLVNDQLGKSEIVEVQGIGTFENVQTHHSDLHHVSFKPDEQLKVLVNAPFECFEPMVIEAAPMVTKVEETSMSETPEVIPENEETKVNSEIEKPQFDSVIEEEEKNLAVEQKPVEEKYEEPVEEEKPVIVEQDDMLIIKQPEKKKNDSNNLLTYSAIALILIACGLLVWLMVGNDPNASNTAVEAEIVEKSEVKPRYQGVLTEEHLRARDTLNNVNDINNVNDSINVDQSSVNEFAEPIVEEAPTVVDEMKLVEEVKKPEEKENPVEKEKKPVVPTSPKEFHRLKGADGKPVTVTLKAGERLTLVALEHFGDKAFWPYIFDANADKLKAPNLVQAGMTLYLPDPAYYGIDAKDEASLQKAKNRAAQLLK